MKKIISALLISVSAFTTVSSASCSAVWPFTKRSATVSTTVSKEKSVKINLKDIEAKIKKLSDEEKIKLKRFLDKKESLDSSSFSNTLEKIMSITGKAISSADTIVSSAFKIFVMWYGMAFASTLCAGKFSIGIRQLPVQQASRQ